MPRGYALTKAASTRGSKVARLLTGGLQVVIDGLTGLIRQLEPHWPSRLVLPYRCTVHCITVWGNILDLDRDDIAATKLAIDSQVKQGEVASSPLHEQSVLIDQTCFGRRGSIAPISLPLFQGMRWLVGARFSLSGMVVLLRYKDDEHAPRMQATKSCPLSECYGHENACARIGLVANDPIGTSLATESDSLGGRHGTTVDDVFGAGDGRSAWRGEERNKVRDFSRFRWASNRDATERGHQRLLSARVIGAGVFR